MMKSKLWESSDAS